MTSVVGISHARNPIGGRADGCNRDESSRTDPSDIGEAGERVIGRCCGRCFHWSRLFTTLIYARQQILKKSGEVAFFRGEVLSHELPGSNDERGEREGGSYQEWEESGEA